MGKFSTRTPGDKISVALRKLFQGGQKGSQAIYSVQQGEQVVWTSKIRWQVREFRVLCVGRCKPLGSLNSFLSKSTSAIWGQSCFLVHLKEWQMAASCIPSSSSAITIGGWQASAGSQFWKPSFTFGGQKLLMAMILHVYWRCFHFTVFSSLFHSVLSIRIMDTFTLFP